MSDGVSFWWKLFFGVIAVYVAYKIVLYLFASLISLLIPLVVIGAIGYVAYTLINRKAIGGGRRILP